MLVSSAKGVNSIVQAGNSTHNVEHPRICPIIVNMLSSVGKGLSPQQLRVSLMPLIMFRFVKSKKTPMMHSF